MASTYDESFIDDAAVNSQDEQRLEEVKHLQFSLIFFVNEQGFISILVPWQLITKRKEAFTVYIICNDLFWVNFPQRVAAEVVFSNLIVKEARKLK